jgi:hypothetical protein
MGLQVSADSDSDRPEAGRRSLAAGAAGAAGPGRWLARVVRVTQAGKRRAMPEPLSLISYQSLSKYGGRAERHTRGGQAER